MYVGFWKFFFFFPVHHSNGLYLGAQALSSCYSHMFPVELCGMTSSPPSESCGSPRAGSRTHRGTPPHRSAPQARRARPPPCFFFFCILLSDNKMYSRLISCIPLHHTLICTVTFLQILCFRLIALKLELQILW